MPIGEDYVMFEESWTSPTTLVDELIEKPCVHHDNKPNAAYTTNLVPTHPTVKSTTKVQCPTCTRFFPSDHFGRCIGAPVSEFPLLRGQIGSGTRKRKRTETKTAHETSLAPCNDCLDDLGEDEGATWGRCDNPKCWSRREDLNLPSFASRTKSNWAFSFAPGTHHQLDPSLSNDDELALGLVCPKCSPEGGLGCTHKWICDICAFWDKHPLVWECPACLNDYCEECEQLCFGGTDEEERCFECGKKDLCRSCREGMLLNPPTDSSNGLDLLTLNSRLFTWRCRICSFPVCSGCIPAAHANGRIDSCRNCCSLLCGACRSVLACQRCGEEMCQLCLGESLVMLCRKCERS